MKRVVIHEKKVLIICGLLWITMICHVECKKKRRRGTLRSKKKSVKTLINAQGQKKIVIDAKRKDSKCDIFVKNQNILLQSQNYNFVQYGPS